MAETTPPSALSIAPEGVHSCTSASPLHANEDRSLVMDDVLLCPSRTYWLLSLILSSLDVNPLSFPFCISIVDFPIISLLLPPPFLSPLLSFFSHPQTLQVFMQSLTAMLVQQAQRSYAKISTNWFSTPPCWRSMLVSQSQRRSCVRLSIEVSQRQKSSL